MRYRSALRLARSTLAVPRACMYSMKVLECAL